jgi:hypothetical protein
VEKDVETEELRRDSELDLKNKYRLMLTKSNSGRVILALCLPQVFSEPFANLSYLSRINETAVYIFLQCNEALALYNINGKKPRF